MDVSDLQRKLGTWAAQDQGRKCFDLDQLWLDAEWWPIAHEHGKRNRGRETAGTEGITMRDLDAAEEGHLRQRREALKAGTCQPVPVRRVR
jgi:hypothetical protein